MDDYRLDSNLGDDSSEFAKAFTAEYFVPTESETIEVARQSWIQFAEKSKQLVVAHNLLHDHFSACESANDYKTAFAPILNQAKKVLDCSTKIVSSLCFHLHNLHEK